MALTRLVQDDFSAGAFRGTARHQIPKNGSYTLSNLLVDDTGALYRRGGTQHVTPTLDRELRWVWDGKLAGGQRTVAASPQQLGVLSNDETRMIGFGFGGTALPPSHCVLDGVLYIAPGFAYAGGRKLSTATGTANITNGSKVVTGTGTAWTFDAEPGMFFKLAGRLYVVASVDSDSQITLRDPVEEATATGQAYTLTSLATLSTPYQLGTIFATAGDRLFVASGSRIRFSQGRSDTGVIRAHVFQPTDYHEIPDGAEIVAMEALRDVMYVFTTAGVYAITNLFFDLTDDAGNVQQTIEQVDPNMVALTAHVAGWAGALIVGCADGVWMLSPASSPVKISKSIDGLWADYIRKGYRPCQGAVHNGHLFLPILNAQGSSVNLLVCRLDRPAKDDFKQTVWPWSWLTGYPAVTPSLTVRTATRTVTQTTSVPSVTGTLWGSMTWGTSQWNQRAMAGSSTTVTVSVSGTPQLVCAGAAGRVVSLNSIFDPSLANTTDADGSIPSWVFEGRDVLTGPNNNNQARRVRLQYDLDRGMVQGYYSTGREQNATSKWGQFSWGQDQWSDAELGEYQQLPSSAPSNTGREQHEWPVNARTTLIRARLQSDSPSGRFSIRSLDFAIRPSTKDR